MSDGVSRCFAPIVAACFGLQRSTPQPSSMHLPMNQEGTTDIRVRMIKKNRPRLRRAANGWLRFAGSAPSHWGKRLQPLHLGGDERREVGGEHWLSGSFFPLSSATMYEAII
jgi:hypothetical protein